MGDPEQIGIELNKQHNPFLGWVLKITNVMVIFFDKKYFFICPIIVNSLSSNELINDIPKEDIVYKIDIDEKVKVR